MYKVFPKISGTLLMKSYYICTNINETLNIMQQETFDGPDNFLTINMNDSLGLIMSHAQPNEGPLQQCALRQGKDTIAPGLA